MSASDLIAMGVDVASQDEECDAIVCGLDALIKSEGDGEVDVMVRAIVRTLRDAADAAVEIESSIGDSIDTDPSSGSAHDRLRRVSAHLTAALAELSS